MKKLLIASYITAVIGLITVILSAFNIISVELRCLIGWLLVIMHMIIITLLLIEDKLE